MMRNKILPCFTVYIIIIYWVGSRRLTLTNILHVFIKHIHRHALLNFESIKVLYRWYALFFTGNLYIVKISKNLHENPIQIVDEYFIRRGNDYREITVFHLFLSGLRLGRNMIKQEPYSKWSCIIKRYLQTWPIYYIRFIPTLLK